MRMELRVTPRTQGSKGGGINPVTLFILNTPSSLGSRNRHSIPSGQLLLQHRCSTSHCSTLHRDRPQHPLSLRGLCPRAPQRLSPPPQKRQSRVPLSTSPSRPSSSSSLMTTHARSAHSPLHTTPPMLTHTPPTSPSLSDGKAARGRHLCMDTFLPPSR